MRTSLLCRPAWRFAFAVTALAIVACRDATTAPASVPRVPTVSFLRAQYFGGPRRLMIAALGAPDPTPITPPTEDVFAYSWAPDGSLVAYLAASRVGVRIIARDGSREHGLAGTDQLTIPTSVAWSPDGETVAVSDVSTLWFVSSRTGAVTTVPGGATGGFVWPAWAPDSRRMAFTSNADATLGIVTTGGAVTRFAVVGSHPDWHPDGTELAYDAIDGRIWTVNADGSEPRPVNADCPSGSACAGATFASPRWSPDGLRFVASVSPNSVAIMRADGTDVRVVHALQSNPGVAVQARWSADGRVLFLDDNSGRPAPYVMNADGSGLAAVTSGGWFDDAPRWVP